MIAISTNCSIKAESVYTKYTWSEIDEFYVRLYRFIYIGNIILDNGTVASSHFMDK